MSALPQAARSTLLALGATRLASGAAGKWRCPHCDKQVFQSDLEGERFHCRVCCGRMQHKLQAWGFFDILSQTRRGQESLVQQSVPGVVARQVETSGDWTIAGPLLIETVSKQEVKWAIERHHEHHEPPQSAILGVRCAEKLYTGETALRGVGTLSTPTSRRLMQKGTHLEVNRLCTWGPKWRRHNVISRISGQLREEARRLRSEAQETLENAPTRRDGPSQAQRRAGIGRLRTYILERESGASLRAGGWYLVGRSEGGSWARSREGRSRRPKTEGAKWVYDTPL